MTLPALLLQISLLLLVKLQATNSVAKSTSPFLASSSSWLRQKVVNQRPSGCWNRPWIRSRGEIPPTSLCCRNRCADVTSDINNCGLCGIRCLFNWQCCGGLCTDINTNTFNCGSCGNICPAGSFCSYGMCGYAQLPPPPFPAPTTSSATASVGDKYWGFDSLWF